MTIEQMKKRRDKIDRRVNRNQKWRKRLLKVQKGMERRGQKGLARQLEKVTDNLRARVKDLHADLADVEKAIDTAKQKADKGRTAYLKFLEQSVGKAEGTDWQRQIAADIGVPAEWPWCSTLTAYGLIHFGGFTRDQLPANPAYSGAWLTWSGGTRVSYADRQPGDLLIFDWGDGGMTDHVATYIGSDLKIGGNENNRVERDAVPAGYVVGVVRPKWN